MTNAYVFPMTLKLLVGDTGSQFTHNIGSYALVFNDIVSLYLKSNSCKKSYIKYKCFKQTFIDI